MQSWPSDQGSSPLQNRSPHAGSRVPQGAHCQLRGPGTAATLSLPEAAEVTHSPAVTLLSSHTTQAAAHWGLRMGAGGQRGSGPAKTALLGRAPRQSATIGRSPSEWTGQAEGTASWGGQVAAQMGPAWPPPAFLRVGGAQKGRDTLQRAHGRWKRKHKPEPRPGAPVGPAAGPCPLLTWQPHSWPFGSHWRPFYQL